MIDVVVVGAGVLGLSVAAHLLEKGAKQVVVVEADTPAAATSGAGAGFVGLWAAGYANFLTETDLELERYGIGYYGRMSGIDHRANGNLFLATTDDGWSQGVEPVLHHPFAPPGPRAVAPAEV